MYFTVARMLNQLLTSREVDRLFRYSAGRAVRLAKAGLIPHIVLPDGEIRFDEAELETLLKRHPQGKEPTLCTT